MYTLASLAESTVCGNTPIQIHVDFADLGGNCIVDSCDDSNSDGTPDACDGSGDCAADMDGSSVVDIEDLLLFMDAWGTPAADLNGDGSPDINDLLMLMGMWGPCI